jgi:predicted nicotinamide N-methyase
MLPCCLERKNRKLRTRQRSGGLVPADMAVPRLPRWKTKAKDAGFPSVFLKQKPAAFLGKRVLKLAGWTGLETIASIWAKLRINADLVDC